ncbi:MAG TPA: hypothetical protein PKY59_22635 [Pyrinomonadaceae bacterium]|nr:hypothetical protein [Pyrinomonadaceae bacterium]
MKISLKNFAGLFLLFCAVLGCGRFGGLMDRRSFFEGERAKEAAKAIKEKIGKPFKVTEVFIEKNEFRVQAQDPNNPKNLDEYKFVGGFVTGPQPVKLNGMNEDLEKSTFPFDDINFDAIPAFTKEAIERSGIDGAQIYRMTFQRGFAITERGAGSLGNAAWRIEIKGEREDVTASAAPDGKLLGIDLSRTSRAKDYKVITPEELEKAQNTIKNALGENLMVSKIVIYENNLMFSSANPQNKSVEDNFQYGINGLTKNGLVQMPKITSVIGEDFSINSVDLKNAAKFLERTKQRVGMPDGVVSSLSIRRSTVSVMSKTMRTVWDVNLKKGVNEGSVYFDNDGNEIRVRKNGETIWEEKRKFEQ